MSQLETRAWFRPTSFPDFYQRLVNKFRRFLLTKQLCDVTFHCKDGIFWAHKIIMAMASPFLKKLFLDVSKEGDSESNVEISLPDVAVEDLSCFVEACYFGALPTDELKLKSCMDLSAFLMLHVNGELGNICGTVLETVVSASGLVLEELVLHPEKLLEKRKKIQEIRESQRTPCLLCKKKAVDHKVVNACPQDSESNKKSFHYACCASICGALKLKNARAFNNHVKARHTSKATPSSMPICPICSKPRLAHKNKQHVVQGGRRVNCYKCCMCSAAKLRPKNFLEHAMNHIEKRFSCEECGKGFSYEHLMRTHYDRMHGADRDKVLLCPEEGCDFRSKYAQSISSHRREKHSGIRRVHKPADDADAVACETCKKVLRKGYYLHFHKRACMTGTLYRCDLCDQEGFTNSITLRNHIRARHTDDRPHACEHCPARYATSMALSGHRANKHGVNKAGEVVPKKLFPCEMCGKLLSTHTKLQAHIRVVHENVKDFKCGYCDKRFTSSSNLRVHAVAHTGILPHTCDVCQMGFARKGALATHRQQHEVAKEAQESEALRFGQLSNHLLEEMST